MPDATLPLRTDALTGGERTELFRLVGSTAGCLPGTPCRVPDGAQAHCSPSCLAVHLTPLRKSV